MEVVVGRMPALRDQEFGLASRLTAKEDTLRVHPKMLRLWAYSGGSIPCDKQHQEYGSVSRVTVKEDTRQVRPKMLQWLVYWADSIACGTQCQRKSLRHRYDRDQLIQSMMMAPKKLLSKR